MPPYNNDYRYDYTFAYPDYATTATTYTGNRLVWNTTTETTRPTLSVGEIDSLIDIKIKEAFEKLYKERKMTGRLKDISMNLDGSQDLRITFNADLGEMFYELYGKDVNVEIKRIYKRRSLDANALCWYIIDKIAEKMKTKKSEVYRNAIRDIGGVSDIVCVRDFAVDKLTRGTSLEGLLRQLVDKE